jgi:holo-[acyl-carrier protein] synthase
MLEAAMVLGIGTDVLEVARVRRAMAEDEEGFRRQLFTPSEIAGCEAARDPAAGYAARFAAKEALYKALGDVRLDGAFWRAVEVEHDSSGAWRLRPLGEVGAEMSRRAATAWLSVSSTRRWATACVVLEAAPWQGA